MFKTKYAWTPRPSCHNSTDMGVSVTQPNDSLTIQQILVRVSQGLTTGVGASTSDSDYDDPNDDDFEDPTLDPEFDKLEALSYMNSEEVEQTVKAERKRRQKKKEKEQEDAFAAEAAKRGFVRPSTTAEEPPK